MENRSEGNSAFNMHVSSASLTALRRANQPFTSPAGIYRFQVVSLSLTQCCSNVCCLTTHCGSFERG
ncbi:hypothetical protein ABKN59_008446 [Abortiporus biennis]